MQFVAGRGHYDTVIAAVRNARTSVWIATANLKELMIEDTRWSVRRTRRRGTNAYRSVIEVFDELVTAGVEIRLLHAAQGSLPFREELARHANLVPVSRLKKARSGKPRSGAGETADAATPLRGIAKPRKTTTVRAKRGALVPTLMIGLAPPTAPRVSGVFPVGAPPSAVAGGRFEMRLCPRVHLKAVVVDGAFLYLGSANWTGAGLGAKGTGRRNFELGIVTDDSLLLDDVQEIFDRIWRGAECKDCKLREACPAPLDRSALDDARRRAAGTE